MTVQDSIKALNDAAYIAATLLRKANDPRAARAKRIALETDDLVDGAAR